MGIARMLITPELVAEFLRLPGGTRIVRAEMDEARHVVLTLSHPDIRVVEADADALPPIVKPLYQSSVELDARSITFLGWGQG